MTTKKKFAIIYIILSILALFTIFFSFNGTNNIVYAQIEKTLINTREEFSKALSKKQAVINVGDIDFGESDISINISYSVEIIGKSDKSAFLNAHFIIEGGNTVNDITIVKFKNIKFNGIYDTKNKVVENGKTFAENFGGERENPCYKAFAPTGIYNLIIENCEFYNYVGKTGVVIFRQNGESSLTNSYLTIKNSKFYDNICEQGTIYLADKSLIVSITNCEMYNNTAQICSGISIWGAKTEIDKVNIHDNNFVNFSSNNYKYGGGLFVASCDMVVKNSNITNCTAFNGGGAYIVNSNATFYNCKILNNKAVTTGTSLANILYSTGGYGGGVLVLSNEGQIVKFENCNISANSSINGGAVAVMPFTSNTKGGRVEILFSSIGLNNQEDNNAIKYYGYSQNNLGLLDIKGSIIIDETDFENSQTNYNYISTKEQALTDNIITTEIIENVKTNGLEIVSGSKADITISKNTYKSWDLFSKSNMSSRKIGAREVKQESQNNKTLIISLSVLIPVLSLTIVATIILVVKKKQKKDIIINQKETIENQSVELNETSLSENKKLESNADKITFTSEDIDKIIKNIESEITLSKKEIEVLKLALLGKQRKEMATESFVTLHTIKKHLASIYAKLNVSSRKELMEKAKEYLR